MPLDVLLNILVLRLFVDVSYCASQNLIPVRTMAERRRGKDGPTAVHNAQFLLHTRASPTSTSPSTVQPLLCSPSSSPTTLIRCGRITRHTAHPPRTRTIANRALLRQSRSSSTRPRQARTRMASIQAPAQASKAALALKDPWRHTPWALPTADLSSRKAGGGPLSVPAGLRASLHCWKVRRSERSACGKY